MSWSFISTDHDQDAASLRLAMQLDAELNGNPQPGHQSTGTDFDADLAFAMQLDDQLNSRHHISALESPFDEDSEQDQELSNLGPDGEPSIRGGGRLGKESGKSNYHDHRRHHSSSVSTSSPRIFATFAEFATHMQSQKCAKCSSTLIQNQKDIEDLFKGWLTGQGLVESLVNCKRCSTLTCVGCGSRPLEKKLATEINVQGTKLTWCCSRGRLFVIWAILCGFDQQYCVGRQQEATKTGTGRRGNTSSGIGYGGNNYFGVGPDFIGPDYVHGPFHGGVFGYGGGLPSRYSYRPAHEQDQGKIKAQNAQSVSDNFNKMILAFLDELLPSLDRSSNFDMSPPEAVPSMLLNSKILDKAAELLRNDSLEDIAKRKELYQALLSFLRVIGTHPITASKTMYSERIVRPDTVNLLNLSFQKGVGALDQKQETTASLGDCLRNLNLQSSIMLQGAQKNEGEFRTQEGQDLLWLCRQVYDLAEFLLANTTRGSGALNKDDKENMDHGIFEIADQQIFATNQYAHNARNLRESPRGRMKRLITEITTLKTGLPPGIFVKYGTSRLDLMKMLIVGPAGTPYENGLFEFDLWCPGNYPYEAPKVTFKGTRGGSISFNPNLHLDGKVCLSLLGTWHGEPWRPAESTILQVLISIQAMILCDEPICNEPSQEGFRGSSESQSYNQNLRKLTTRYAILDWVENPPALWKDITVQHFKRNGARILQTVGQWEKACQIDSPYDHRGIFGMQMTTAYTENISDLRPKLQAALQMITGSLQSQGCVASRQSFSPTTKVNQAYGRGYGGQMPSHGGRGGFSGSNGIDGQGSRF
ncbi:hypothetical protein CC78DRAFT_588598 [Lojkania enalia]|uniref:UBC core domain-containing protein n=1 Tax=Lojkania enalia TaxID=147567 RepID=A0A9P4NCL0_9PLEO|nr:hypothetical protein CC78DRAFT_588598 [Didymosphaeria enalia]